MLRKQAQAPEPELRRKAADSLGMRHGTGQGDLLAGLLSDKDAQVRGTAAKWLGGLSDHTAAHEDAIAELLEDPDPFVRHSAADALRVAKAIRYLPEIKKLRQDPDEKVRWRARICVDFMTRSEVKG